MTPSSGVSVQAVHRHWDGMDPFLLLGKERRGGEGRGGGKGERGGRREVERMRGGKGGSQGR